MDHILIYNKTLWKYVQTLLWLYKIHARYFTFNVDFIHLSVTLQNTESKWQGGGRARVEKVRKVKSPCWQQEMEIKPCQCKHLGGEQFGTSNHHLHRWDCWGDLITIPRLSRTHSHKKQEPVAENQSSQLNLLAMTN